MIVVLVVLAFYNERSNQNLNRQVEQEVARRNHLMKYFRGTKFTYKSTFNQIKQSGRDVESRNSTSLHVFDLLNMTVTNTSHTDGEIKKTTYKMIDYSKAPGVGSIHVLKIDSLGLKEIRLNPEVRTIEYYYNTGEVYIYGDITPQASFDMVSTRL
jgi:hypothetical protein